MKPESRTTSEEPAVPRGVGRATHYSIQEGGTWFPWRSMEDALGQKGKIFAVKFDSGWIWDQLVGWRRHVET